MDMARGFARAELAHSREHDALRVAAKHARLVGAVKEEEALADLCCRLEYGLGMSDSAKGLLEPIAEFIAAERAVLRSMAASCGRAVPFPIGALEIPSSVGDAYGERFHALDPARRLPPRGGAGPVFSDPDRPGQWLDVQMSPASSRQLCAEFSEYRRAFLEPNNFVRHIGFNFNDGSGRTMLFDFHRGREAPRFGRLEIARTRVVACYLAARMASRSAPVMQASGSAALGSLSSRESEVAAEVAKGLSNKQVAAALNISVRTVENHMRSIFAKLGVSSRTRLTAVFHGTSTPDRARSD
jgi:DNA-binding CsgD family transcriptional regulator